MHAARHTSRGVYTMFWTLTEIGHIMVLIQNRDGLQIKKKNLTYLELKQLVEKLEGLC